jgi:hypothetical protein
MKSLKSNIRLMLILFLCYVDVGCIASLSTVHLLGTERVKKPKQYSSMLKVSLSKQRTGINIEPPRKLLIHQDLGFFRVLGPNIFTITGSY